jgi:hypothetical protein
MSKNAIKYINDNYSPKLVETKKEVASGNFKVLGVLIKNF